MATRSINACLTDLRNRGFDELADSVEVIGIVTESLQAVVCARFPSIIDGSPEQADVVMGLLPLVVRPSDGGSDDPAPSDAGGAS